MRDDLPLDMTSAGLSDLSDRAFVFGYGSLAAQTALQPTRQPRAEGFVTDLRGFVRRWGVAMDNRRDLPGYKFYASPAGGRPAVNVCFLDIFGAAGDASVNGLCLPIDAASLARLDDRERNYVRLDVTPAVDARGARVWAYVGSDRGRERFADGVRTGRAVIAADYLRAVDNAFRALGPSEHEACRRSLAPGRLPVVELVRRELP